MPENVETQELSHKDCIAANSRSMGPQQQNTDDHNCPFDNAERSTSADRRLADVDDQRRQLFMCNCSSGIVSNMSAPKIRYADEGTLSLSQ